MPLCIFGDESGQVGGKHFLVGLLYLPAASREGHEGHLRRIKMETGFRGREVHYHKLNRAMAKTAKTFIDWFLAVPDISFRCTVVPGGKFDTGRFDKNLQFISAGEMAYNVIYARTLTFHTRPDESAQEKIIIVDSKDKARPDEFERFVRQRVGRVLDFQEVRSENHGLLQLADLLAGCVFGELNGVQKFDKRDVIDHLKHRLGVGSFTQRNALTAAKFRLAFWRGAEKRSSPTST